MHSGIVRAGLTIEVRKIPIFLHTDLSPVLRLSRTLDSSLKLPFNSLKTSFRSVFLSQDAERAEYEQLQPRLGSSNSEGSLGMLLL